MPTNDSQPAHSTLLSDPVTPREALLDQIALEAATGSTTAQLAHRFGYTYSGMSKLVAREDFQQRMQYYSARLEDMRHIAHKKILFHIPNLLNNELAVGLQGEDPDTGTIDIAKASSPAAQKARHFLIDKVMPTTTRVENSHEVSTSPEAREVLVELRTVLKRINDERGTRENTRSIIDSPHVLEGVSALPSPLLEKKD